MRGGPTRDRLKAKEKSDDPCNDKNSYNNYRKQQCAMNPYPPVLNLLSIYPSVYVVICVYVHVCTSDPPHPVICLAPREHGHAKFSALSMYVRPYLSARPKVRSPKPKAEPPRTHSHRGAGRRPSAMRRESVVPRKQMMVITMTQR